MKKAALLILFVLAFSACNDDKRAERPGEPVSEGEDTTERTFTRDAVEEERDAVVTEDEGVRPLTAPADYEFAGQYKKEGEEESDGCNCDCLEVNFTTTSQLCIAEDQMYISARFVKTGSNTANIFLVEPADIANAEEELPWDEFDRDTPIATIELQPNGNLELDWKGFTIDGELATDYAIYGKKTLEGTYKRQ